MESRGSCCAYVGGTEGIPVPMIGDKQIKRTPPRKVPTGLDWAKHSAPGADVVELPAAAPTPPRSTPPATSSGRVYLTAEQQAEICRRYVEDQLSSKYLAGDYGVADQTILNALKRHGVARRGRKAAAQAVQDLKARPA